MSNMVCSPLSCLSVSTAVPIFSALLSCVLARIVCASQHNRSTASYFLPDRFASYRYTTQEAVEAAMDLMSRDVLTSSPLHTLSYTGRWCANTLEPFRVQLNIVLGFVFWAFFCSIVFLQMWRVRPTLQALRNVWHPQQCRIMENVQNICVDFELNLEILTPVIRYVQRKMLKVGIGRQGTGMSLMLQHTLLCCHRCVCCPLRRI